MNKEISQILQKAKKALNEMERGKIYAANYVVGQFEKAAAASPHDQLIGNMRDVLLKKAKTQEFLTQNEIGEIYDHMVGLASGNSSFREVLGDFLPSNRQIAEQKVSAGSKTRQLEEKGLEPIHKDSKLSRAFETVFDLGKNASFGTLSPVIKNNGVEKAVIAELGAMGCSPESVELGQTNEHFVLCTAIYNTPKHKVAVQIPVQISDGVVKYPDSFIQDGNVVPLTKSNLLVHLKEAESFKQNGISAKIAGDRGDGTSVKIEKKIVPVTLERFAVDMENNLIAAANNFSVNQVNSASNLVASELFSIGLSGSQIKVASSDSKGLIFDVILNTALGKAAVSVPIEIRNGSPILPSKFAAENKNGNTIYSFDKAGFDSFLSSASSVGGSVKIARITGEMGKMSYHELVDRIVDGVANKDYRVAEDALEVIQSRFGSDMFMTAFDKFSDLLKYSSERPNHDSMIKNAVQRGDLIKVPTTVEWFCPQYGLPLSKLSFDEKGKLSPKGRHVKSENIAEGTAISTNKIRLT